MLYTIVSSIVSSALSKLIELDSLALIGIDSSVNETNNIEVTVPITITDARIFRFNFK